jgi:hypothetical protein
VASNCPAITGKGEPCKGFVHSSKMYCPAHDPSRVEARRKAASKAGRSKGPAAELVELRGMVKRYMADVESGRLEKGRGSVLAQLAGVAGRLYEAEAKIRELLEVRIPEYKELQQEIAEVRELVEQAHPGSRRTTWAG